MVKKTLTRRSFLHCATAWALGAAIVGCVPMVRQVSQPTVAWPTPTAGTPIPRPTPTSKALTSVPSETPITVDLSPTKPAETEVVIEETGELVETQEPQHRKYYVDGGHVEIAAHLVYELDSDGSKLRVVKYTEYTAEKVRTLFPSAVELLKKWSDADKRSEIIEALAERGIDFKQLADAAGQPDADPFDLLCHVAYNAPLRTRRERAACVRTEKKDFFEQYGSEAKAVLHELLEKYAEYGVAQFVLPDVLQVPPISSHGNVAEIAKFFGGPEQLKKAVKKMQELLYAA